MRDRKTKKLLKKVQGFSPKYSDQQLKQVQLLSTWLFFWLNVVACQTCTVKKIWSWSVFVYFSIDYMLSLYQVALIKFSTKTTVI